jgi:hypothetical protein
MSMIATNAYQGNTRMRTCGLPHDVRDSRYPDESLGYVFVVHNHPAGEELSDFDIRFIVNQGSRHGFSVKIRGREVPLGIVAFFSRSWEGGKARCDGFFQYTPITGELVKWSADEKTGWKQEPYGKVEWDDSGGYRIERW